MSAMKKWFLTVTLLSLYFLGSCGKPYEWLKPLPFGTSCFNQCLIETVDHGYLILIVKYHSGVPYVTSFLIRTDINGIILWYKEFRDGLNAYNLFHVVQTSDKGYILTGSTSKYDPTGYFDPVIIKLSPCGELEWCSNISTPGIYDNAFRIRQVPSGEYVLLTSYSDPAENNRIQLYKLSSTGQWLWKRNYPALPPFFGDDGNDVTVLDDGFLVSGKCYAPDPGMPPGVGYERPYFFRTDTAGNVLWRNVYGLGNGFHGFVDYYTLISPTGHFYSTGWHSNTCDTPALIKCMADGTEGYYQDVIPNSCPGSNGSLNFFDDTTLVMRASGKIGGVWHIKWIRMDTLGIEQFSRSIADNPYIGASSWSIVTHDKKIVGLSKHNNVNYLFKLNAQFEYDSVYGYLYVYDSLCPYPIVSDTIDPVCDLLVGTEEKVFPVADTRLRAWPNPARDRVTVEVPRQLEIMEKDGGSVTYDQWGQCTLEVYSLSGGLVYRQTVEQSDRMVEILTATWPRGMYCFRLVYRGGTCTSALVLLN